MNEKLNLYQKIQAVSMEIMNIEKDMTVGSGNYSYKAISDNVVVLAVKKAEEKYKLISIPIKQELVNTEIKEIIKGNNTSLKFIDNIKMTVRIVDLEDSKSFVDVEAYGKGIDNGDKGFGKASTYARKIALLNVYKIATGEDVDADKSQVLETMSVNEKRIIITQVMENDDKLSSNVLTHFGVVDVESMTDIIASTVYNQFKNKSII